MAARFEDAKMGWDILRQSGFALSRDELNARLESRGFAPISRRTFAHYDKLRRYGYENYIPINQLDVKTLQDPLWDKAVRGRYPVYHVPEKVHIICSRGASPLEVPGKTIELSSSYVRMRVDDRDAFDLLSTKSFRQDLKAGRVVVTFPRTGDTYAAVVEEITLHVQESFASLVLGFVSLASIEHIIGRTLLPTGKLRVRISPTADSPLLADVVRKLYWLTQALETSKVIAEEYLVELGLDEEYAVPSVRVQELSMRSPLTAVVVASLPTLILVAVLTERVLKARAEYYEGSRRREEAKYLRMRNQLFAEVSDSIKRRILKAAEHDGGQARLPIDGSAGRADELAESQLFPSLEELLDRASGEIEFEDLIVDEDQTA